MAVRDQVGVVGLYNRERAERPRTRSGLERLGCYSGGG